MTNDEIVFKWKPVLDKYAVPHSAQLQVAITLNTVEQALQGKLGVAADEAITNVVGNMLKTFAHP